MNGTDILHTPYHKAHSHFFEYITEFPGLHVGDTLEVKHLSTMKKLRHQLLHDNNVEESLCYRNCFKLNDRKYINFCLEKKCGTKDFMKAADVLGLVKKEGDAQKKHHAPAHHH